MKIFTRLFKNKSHNLCLFHFYCQRKKKEQYKEPYFEEISKAFWIVNGIILLLHFMMALKWNIYLASRGLPQSAAEVFILPFISLLAVALLAFLYRYPQYSNVPYSLLMEELPAKRQDEIRYVFKQLLVTSAGYLSVFFLTAGVHMIGAMIGLNSGLFIGLYILLFLLIMAKFGFATWFIKVTRK